ncbi:unnamed protein product [Acanthoscelides obtectus]|uniref:Uncharacterized protein n=1 Tax=Acanthoscelides obtectus TaxID=200917 RepID=A0A9P0KK39_ACAOB|nr:unnamed protein product [Acanthoscelides obtectus]CAK1664997.1 hypothetical protein AOBTE_LOCUS24600 [Acanthoscelides obtectus]
MCSKRNYKKRWKKADLSRPRNTKSKSC